MAALHGMAKAPAPPWLSARVRFCPTRTLGEPPLFAGPQKAAQSVWPRLLGTRPQCVMGRRRRLLSDGAADFENLLSVEHQIARFKQAPDARLVNLHFEAADTQRAVTEGAVLLHGLIGRLDAFQA